MIGMFEVEDENVGVRGCLVGCVCAAHCCGFELGWVGFGGVEFWVVWV